VTNSTGLWRAVVYIGRLMVDFEKTSRWSLNLCYKMGKYCSRSMWKKRRAGLR